MIPNRYQCHGFSIHADANDADMLHFFRDNIPYEPHMVRHFGDVMARISKPVFLDIGANIGFYSLLAATRFGALVTAVEPNPRNCHLLNLSRHWNGSDIRIMPYAVGQQSGLVRFHHGGSNGGVSEEGSELVPMLPLRTVLPAGYRPDVIKIDVEGFEHQALLSMDWPDWFRPHVFTEFYPALLEANGYPVAYLDFFLGRGYRVFVLDKITQAKIQCGQAGDVMRVFEEAERRETRRIAYLDLLMAP